MSEWHPIETAPKDGTDVDLWVNQNGYFFRIPDCFWGRSDWLADGWVYFKRDYSETHRDCLANVEYDFGVGSVTHWMPLPDPPQFDTNQ